MLSWSEDLQGGALIHITECIYLQNFWVSSHNAEDFEMWVKALDFRAQTQNLCWSWLMYWETSVFSEFFSSFLSSERLLGGVK